MHRCLPIIVLALWPACSDRTPAGGFHPSPTAADTAIGETVSSSSVVVLYNEDSPVSRAIADYYVSRRSVPKSNVCPLQAPLEEEIPRRDYENAIEKPLGEFLRASGLVESTVYIVTTLGLPLKIAGSDGRQATRASVDSELALLYARLKGSSFPTAGSVANPMYRRRDIAFSHAQFPIYLVTRLAAFDLEGVKAMIDRGLQASNRGRVILDARSDDGREGDDWLVSAYLLLPENRSALDESGRVLYDQREVIGYASWGSNDPNRRRRRLGFNWLPGAIATEFVSTDGRTFRRPPETWSFGAWSDSSAMFAGSPQSLAADLVEQGATGASGHVYEPYLDAVPRPDVLFPAYLSGRTLGESYYLAIPQLSWMSIVIGDPLCRLEPAQ